MYENYPLASTPYIAHEVPYSALSKEDKEAADATFNGTRYTTHKMKDYVYLCSVGGGLIGRMLVKKTLDFMH